MTIPTPLRRLPAIGAALTVALSAGACSGASDERADTRSDVATTEVTGASASGVSGTSRSPQTRAAEPAGSDAQVIGSSTGQHRATPNDSTAVPLRLDVTSVKRLAGGTVNVRFTITNTGDTTEFRPYRQLSDPTIKGGGEYDVGGLALLDRSGDKKYLTLYGSDGICLCTGEMDDLEIATGKTVSLYADVTAPPDTVSTVDLTLPGFAPVTGLKVQ